MPTEKEYKPTLMEKVQDCMEQVEYGNSPEAYNFLRKVNQCLVHCHRAGKRSDKMHELLGILTPFLYRYGLEDWRGLELVEEYLTNPDYEQGDADE